MSYRYVKGHAAPVTSSQAGFPHLFCRRTGLSFTPRNARLAPFFRLFFFTVLRQVASELALESDALIPAVLVLMIFFPSDRMLVRPVTTATRKASFKTGNTRVMHMLRCLLLEGHAPGKFILHTVTVPVTVSEAGGSCTFMVAVRVIFFDTGGRLTLDGSSVILYLI
ncbi:hypothetical protein BGY98DRAFT_945290, partial [Russula aff. rugulosa BPL654]